MSSVNTNEATLTATSLYWCSHCDVPLLSHRCENCGEMGIKICSDLKPMFGKECEFLEREVGVLLPGRGWQEGLWMRYKTVWFNGRRMMRLSAHGKPVVIREYLPHDTIRKSKESISSGILYRANKSTIDQREQEAISFVRDVIVSYPGRRPVVSFSGGKDSLVISYIVRKALGVDAVLHMFGNTTMEYPDTIEYVARYREDNKDIPFCENSSIHNFFDMSRLIGPPSRLFAWCCSVFKSAPIAEMVNQIKSTGGTSGIFEERYQSLEEGKSRAEKQTCRTAL